MRLTNTHARSPADAAGAVGQLAVLAGTRHRGWPRRARRSSRPSRASASRARSTSYADYVSAVDLLIRCGAFPEPTFLWWDVRPQPRFGTIEVRIMDAQTTVERDGRAGRAGAVDRAAGGRAGLSAAGAAGRASEALDENRFLGGPRRRRGRADRRRRRSAACRSRISSTPCWPSCTPHARALRLPRQSWSRCTRSRPSPARARQVELARRSPERLAGPRAASSRPAFSSPAGVHRRRRRRRVAPCRAALPRNRKVRENTRSNAENASRPMGETPASKSPTYV